jgi:hypothetical protein
MSTIKNLLLQLVGDKNDSWCAWNSCSRITSWAI